MPLKASNRTITFFRSHVSTKGAAMIGIKIAGIIDKPVNIPVSIVLSVLSNTTSEKAKLIAVPPMALIKVPMVIIVKSRLHNVFFHVTPPLH